MALNGDKLRDSCIVAVDTFRKLGDPAFVDITEKLEYVIGSYNYDGNPVGLNEFAHQALIMLKEVKAKNSRKVNKKVIDDLEKYSG